MGESILNSFENKGNRQDVDSDIDTLRKLLAADVKEHPGKQKFRELFNFIQETLEGGKSVSSIARNLKAVGVSVSPATLSKWIDEEKEVRKKRSGVRDAILKAAIK